MGATADTIWSVPVYLPLLQPQLTAEATASVEQQIGYKLPTE
jgi:SMI1-KNR4 cell-wall